MQDSGWEKGEQSGWGSTLWTRTWTNADGEVVQRAVVEAHDNLPDWFFATDGPTAYDSLAAAKRYATTHPYYPNIRL